MMSSHLNPDAVPMKWAKAVLAMITVGTRGNETAAVNMFLTYDGPAAYAEAQ